MTKRLTKSADDKKLSGICAGIAEYFDVDPVLVRAPYAFITVITGVLPGLITYLVLVWIVPDKSPEKGKGKK